MMNEILAETTMFGIVISILGYMAGLYLKKKTGKGICNPLLIAIIFVIGFLLIFRIDYESYSSSASLISYLLTPATVCLAIPLYEQITLLKKNFKAIIAGIIAGVLTSLVSVWGLAALFQLTHEEYVTLLPKSITTAIGIGVADELGAITTITVAAIIITGVLGNVVGELVFKIFGIKHPIARGIALGTASHAIGTAKAIELGEVEGAMSSLSIVVSGLCTVVGASIFAGFL